MKQPLIDGHGNELAQHECADRTPIAQNIVVIAKPTQGPWQFVTPEARIGIAVKYCPFCGVELPQ